MTGLQSIKCPSSCSDLYNESTIYHSPSESPDDLKDGDNDVRTSQSCKLFYNNIIFNIINIDRKSIRKF